jgi:hypothetical protein
MHGRCIAMLLGCLPCPWQSGQVMEPFPLHSGQGINAFFSALTIEYLLPFFLLRWFKTINVLKRQIRVSSFPVANEILNQARSCSTCR